MSGLPESLEHLIDRPVYAREADCAVNQGNIRALCASVQNASPLYWDAAIARDIAGGEIAPPAMLSTWGRPERWSPEEGDGYKPLQLHFDLKEQFEYPTAIVAGIESVFHEPVVVGDRLHSHQVLRSVSDEKDTRLGRGRFWVIDMEYRNQRNALVGVETFNCFGYRRSAS